MWRGSKLSLAPIAVKLSYVKFWCMTLLGTTRCSGLTCHTHERTRTGLYNLAGEQIMIIARVFVGALMSFACAVTLGLVLLTAVGSIGWQSVKPRGSVVHYVR